MIRKFKNLIKRLSTMMKRRLTSLSAAKQLGDLANIVDNPFFVIVMPGSLHILKAFLRYAPERIEFVLILNGVSQWEKNWLERNYPGFRTITLSSTI